jgi:flavin-dependent dehydrogenase
VPVTVIEAGRYPRHRVCGEFISGDGIGVLNNLGLNGSLEGATMPALDGAFFVLDRKLATHRLPRAALTVSRFHLDTALAKTFRELGGELRTGERWLAQKLEEGVVSATGRRARPVEAGWRWFGLKMHARSVALEADLEMHVARDSYVGLCRLANGEVNVCGLFRRRTNQPGAGEAMNWLRGERDSLLFQRLKAAEFDEESFSAVAGLSLHPHSINPGECRIGDALTMIPPITGNGMSMAFESAQLAVDPLMAYAEGQASWPCVTNKIADVFRDRFRKRLRWAAWLHRGLFFSPSLLRPLCRSRLGWRMMFAATR